MDSLTRLPTRGRTDIADLHALLDEVPWGTLATAVDGRPWQVPMLHARDGNRIILHGSSGAGMLRHLDAGAPASFCVTAMDGLVVAHSTFDHSANYRSAVITGTVSRLEGEEQARALDLFTDQLLPGRSGEVRPSLPKEWAATLALVLPIEDGHWLMKARAGGPSDTDEQHEAWRGVVPMWTAYGDPEPTPDSAGRPVPASVRSVAPGK